MRLAHILFHLISYYIAWFACIFSAAAGNSYIGLVVVLLILLPQWFWQKKFDTVYRFWTFLLLVSVSGFILDSLFLHFSLIDFKANAWPIELSPLWMIGLWINFSVIAYALLRSFFEKWLLLSFLSLIGFALAYYIGARIGAADLPYGFYGPLIIGLAWGLIFPTITLSYHALFWRNRC